MMMTDFYKEAVELANQHGYWSEHPHYSVKDWMADVRDGNTRLGYWTWILFRLLEQRQVVVQNPDSTTIVLTPGLLSDLVGLLDYCQDDREWKDFCNYLLENAPENLTDPDLEALRAGDGDKLQEILEKASSDPNVTHIWAIAHRIRQLLSS